MDDKRSAAIARAFPRAPSKSRSPDRSWWIVVYEATGWARSGEARPRQATPFYMASDMISSVVTMAQAISQSRGGKPSAVGPLSGFDSAAAGDRVWVSVKFVGYVASASISHLKGGRANTRGEGIVVGFIITFFLSDVEVVQGAIVQGVLNPLASRYRTYLMRRPVRRGSWSTNACPGLPW